MNARFTFSCDDSTVTLDHYYTCTCIPVMVLHVLHAKNWVNLKKYELLSAQIVLLYQLLDAYYILIENI